MTRSPQPAERRRRSGPSSWTRGWGTSAAWRGPASSGLQQHGNTPPHTITNAQTQARIEHRDRRDNNDDTTTTTTTTAAATTTTTINIDPPGWTRHLRSTSAGSTWRMCAPCEYLSTPSRFSVCRMSSILNAVACIRKTCRRCRRRRRRRHFSSTKSDPQTQKRRLILKQTRKQPLAKQTA
jgi:hypothetical protein